MKAVSVFRFSHGFLFFSVFVGFYLVTSSYGYVEVSFQNSILPYWEITHLCVHEYIVHITLCAFHKACGSVPVFYYLLIRGAPITFPERNPI